MRVDISNFHVLCAFIVFTYEYAHINGDIHTSIRKFSYFFFKVDLGAASFCISTTSPLPR